MKICFTLISCFLPEILSSLSNRKDDKSKTESFKWFDDSPSEIKLKSVLESLPVISKSLEEEIQYYVPFAGASYCGPVAKTKKYQQLCNIKYSGAKAIECFNKRKVLVSKEKCKFFKIDKDEYTCSSGIRSKIDGEDIIQDYIKNGSKTNVKTNEKRSNKPDQNPIFQCKYCKRIESNITRVWKGDIDDAAIVVNDKTKNQIVVAFRGSHDFKKFTSSSITHKTSYKFGKKLKVNEQYLRNFENIYPKVLTNVLKIIGNKQNQKFKLVLVGHSLGGAMATLAAPYLVEDLNLSPSNIKIFTYGQPRVGNKAFAKWYNSQKYDFIRVVNSDDPVTDFPSRKDNWAHVNNEVWIHKSNYFDCKTSELENPDCRMIPKRNIQVMQHIYVDKTHLDPDGCSDHPDDFVDKFYNSFF